MSQITEALLTNTIQRHFGLRNKLVKSRIPSIFEVGSTDSRIVDEMGWVGYGSPEQIRPGQSVPMKEFYQDFGKRFVVVDYAMGDYCTFMDWDDDKGGVLHRMLPAKGGAMAVAFATLEERVCALFLGTYGFASGTSVATMSDGVSLFNTAHPLSRVNTSVTWSNRPSTDTPLSIASLKEACRQLRMQKAPNGLDILANEPAKLVYGYANDYVAREILAAGYQPYSADYTKNMLAGENIQPIYWPYFETNDGKAWFVLGQTHGLRFIRRQPVRFAGDTIVQSLSHVFVAWDRFTVGASTPRGVYGSYGPV